MAIKVLVALAAALGAAAAFIPAGNPLLSYSGRQKINADGTRTFDWEGVTITATLASATYVRAFFNTTGPVVTRIRTTVNDIDASLVYVDSSANQLGYLVATGARG